jgi:uroporphyrinogen-III synthase
MRTLEGRRVALLEGRKQGELASLVRRLGGEPISAPAVREMPRPEDFEPLLRRIIAGTFSVAVIQTGAGINALCEVAAAHGVLPDLRAALARMTLACRGPKPLATLKQHGLTARIVTAKPHTTDELLEGLARLALDGVPVLVLHYGERNEPLSAALRGRGAALEDACLYEWALPDNLSPLRAVIADLTERRLDAVLFTSQIQFRHLIAVAGEMGCTDAVMQALSRDIVVGAVGPVCASALRQAGLVPDVIPAMPNSVSLVSAVADYFVLTNNGEKE